MPKTSTRKNRRYATVRVLVGPEQVSFPIHPYATEDSTVLQEANRNGPDKENVILRLPNESPKVFDSYCLWMYRHADCRRSADLKGDSMTLFKTHGLATRLGNPTMANEIMDSIVERWNKEGGYPDLYMLKYLFGDEVEESSPLRRWAADRFAPMDVKTFDPIAPYLPNEVLILVARTLRQETEHWEWEEGDSSSYYLPVPEESP